MTAKFRFVSYLFVFHRFVFPEVYTFFFYRFVFTKVYVKLIQMDISPFKIYCFM